MLPPDVTSSSNVLSPWYTVTSRVRLPCCASPTGTLFEPFTRISCNVAVGSKDEATTCVLGRIVAAVGRSGADFNPDDVVVTLCGVELFRKGQPTDLDFDALLEEPLKQRDLPIDIVLGSGSGSYTLLASDLGHEYVNVNADYRS